MKKPFWRRTLNKAQDFVADPDTKRFAKAGGQILNVASQLGQARLGGPLGIAGAAIGALDVLANHVDGGVYRAISDSVAKQGLRPINASGAVALLLEQGHFKNPKVLVKGDDINLVSIPLGDHEIAVVLKKDGSQSAFWSAFVSEDLSVEIMSKLLWTNLSDAITLTYRKGEYDQGQLSASPVEGFESNEYIGPNDPKDFVDKFRRYQKAGISRAFLAIGEPGTGKTTYCFKLAHHLGGRLLIVTPELLDSKDVVHQEIVETVTTFRPSVLLFDDVDRVTKEGLLLSLMDFVRKASPSTLLVSTANDPKKIIEPLRRPGRLGPRVNFPSPDLEWRKKIIELYSKKFGITQDLKPLAKAMDHPKFSHDYIKEVCEQALVEDDDELKLYIERTIEEFSADAEEKKKAEKLESAESPP